MQMRNGPDAAPHLPLFSIGHSNLDWPHFLGLLRLAGVTAVADVRSSPYSRRLPQYSRPELERALGQQGIAYVFLGDLLGGRPADAALYGADGRLDYENVRQTPAFRRGLERLIAGLEGHSVAMLCAEDDPLDCHRGLMITPALAERGIAPTHLRSDGATENTPEMERRLLRAAGLDVLHEGLLAAALSEEDRRLDLAEAYRRMASRKAYRREGGDEDDGE
jgi:uncharacterized protein (DUF488 family)